MNPSNVIVLTNLELTRFFFAIVLLLASSHSFGYLFQWFKIPRVIGEIFGGLVLGPTVLGFFSPDIYAWIFNAFEAEGKLLASIYWLGLVLLLFISGFEMQKSFSRDDGKIILSILAGGTILPFIAGWMAPNFYDISPLVGTENNIVALKIIIGIAVAVTSIPVISKIFIDLKIIHTHFAKIILTTATVEDVILWAALAVATSLLSSQTISLSHIFLTVLLTTVFFATSLLIAPESIKIINNLRVNFLIKSSTTGYALSICFFFAAVASLLNINVVFGALVAGIIIGLQSEKFSTVKVTIKNISLAFFVPIYFAVVGLKLDLIHHFDPLFFLGFLLLATILKTAGTVLAARLVIKDWFSSFNLGVAMNTRGGPGIVLATVAYDMGIISELFFTTLVMLAIITSLMAGYWFKFVLIRKWPLLQ